MGQTASCPSGGDGAPALKSAMKRRPRLSASGALPPASWPSRHHAPQQKRGVRFSEAGGSDSAKSARRCAGRDGFGNGAGGGCGLAVRGSPVPRSRDDDADEDDDGDDGGGGDEGGGDDDSAGTSSDVACRATRLAAQMEGLMYDLASLAAASDDGDGGGGGDCGDTHPLAALAAAAEVVARRLGVDLVG